MLSTKDLASVLKTLRGAENNTLVSSAAFVAFIEEYGLLSATPEEVEKKLATVQLSSYLHHVDKARQSLTVSITKNKSFLAMKTKIEMFEKDMSPLVALSRELGSDNKKAALDKIFSKYSKQWLTTKVPFWFESLFLNVASAAVSVIVVYMLGSFLISNGWLGYEFRIAPLNSAQTNVVLPVSVQKQASSQK
jgi:hypothetical protein